MTLESRTRLGAGAWVPRAVQRLEGLKAETITFRLPKSAAIELLRVRGDENEPLPAECYDGQKTFNGQVSQSANDAAALIYTDLGTRENVPTVGDGTETREVVESDIWKIKGNTLYFFNQYRGLQVIDISSPDDPKVTGTLSLPAVGEQMYVLDDQHVVLLARDCSVSGANGGTTVIVARVESGVPTVLARIPIEGSIAESRLVGSALYVASLMYKQVLLPPVPDPGGSGKTQQEQWEWGTEVSSVDLSNPAQPTVRDPLWFPGYGNVVSATDKYFFVVTQASNNWWESLVQLIDITAPDGTMKRLGVVQPGGRVADKFKLNVAPHAGHGEVLSVICEAASTPDGGRASVLRNYSLADPTSPKELGKIEVGHGESLFATRFDGARVYIVTYQRIDPLWVVDLSNPANPVLSGELHVPGWST
ncbi:MAG: beta-propeller domain-containing protein, partial [Verrucomicrobiia bacterium]